MFLQVGSSNVARPTGSTVRFPYLLNHNDIVLRQYITTLFCYYYFQASRASARPPAVSNTVAAGLASGELVNCPICSRNFASDRIDKHKEICQKTAQKKRKVYDALKHRVQVIIIHGVQLFMQYLFTIFIFIRAPMLNSLSGAVLVKMQQVSVKYQNDLHFKQTGAKSTKIL